MKQALFLLSCGIIFSMMDAAECNINQSPIQVAYYAYVNFAQQREQVGLLKRVFLSSKSSDYRMYLSEEKKLDPADRKQLKQMITDYEKSLKQ